MDYGNHDNVPLDFVCILPPSLREPEMQVGVCGCMYGINQWVCLVLYYACQLVSITFHCIIIIS